MKNSTGILVVIIVWSIRAFEVNQGLMKTGFTMLISILTVGYFIVKQLEENNHKSNNDDNK